MSPHHYSPPEPIAECGECGAEFDSMSSYRAHNHNNIANCIKEINRTLHDVEYLLGSVPGLLQHRAGPAYDDLQAVAEKLDILRENLVGEYEAAFDRSPWP